MPTQSATTPEKGGRLLGKHSIFTPLYSPVPTPLRQFLKKVHIPSHRKYFWHSSERRWQPVTTPGKDGNLPQKTFRTICILRLQPNLRQLLERLAPPKETILYSVHPPFSTMATCENSWKRWASPKGTITMSCWSAPSIQPWQHLRQLREMVYSVWAMGMAYSFHEKGEQIKQK